MKRFYHIIIIIFCSLSAMWAHGQYSLYGTVNPTATIQSVMVLSITNNASNSITITSSADYSSGYTVQDLYSVAIKSNVPWNFYVAATTTNFSASGAYSSTTMPASIIRISLADKATGLQLTTSNQLLSSGPRGDNLDVGNSFKLDLNANPGYNYGPGIYTLTIKYTLSAQ